MARSQTLTAAAALLLAALLVLPACNRDLSCTSEVTAGNGIFRGTALGPRAEADLRREAVRAACGQLCAADPAGAEACVGRCVVDIASAKIGARTSCKKGGSAQ